MWQELTRSYQSYCEETFPIHGSQPELRKMFAQAIRRESATTRPPLVSMIPAYETSSTPEELLNRDQPPRLHHALRNLTSSFDPKRPLYRHQVEAISAIQKGQNTVVATGTGSGKTEAFLLPILDHCARAPAQGVQAILVYPMNALANDQLDRLRELLGNTGITIGRYTGETPENDEELDDDARKYVKPFERATREQIRAKPPQILLTNFAMLEYLLLRPRDQSIFKSSDLRFVVLDEAHSYRGSQGIDISLLMKRLQLRYAKELQFILTSATLGDPNDSANRSRIASFATDLTGAPFTSADVVNGHVIDPFGTSATEELSAESIQKLSNVSGTKFIAALGGARDMTALLADLGIYASSGDQANDVLYNTFRRYAALHRMYQRLRKSAATIQDLALDVTKGERVGAAAIHATTTLLAAASLAIPSDGRTAPLLAIRLHHFFRGFGGASALLESVGRGVVVKKLFLERKTVDDVKDPETDVEPTGRSLVALFTCAHCGMPAVGIQRDDAKWTSPIINKPQRELDLLTWLDLDQMVEEEEGAGEINPNYMYLCMEDSCRCIGEGVQAACGHPGQLRLLRLPSADDDGLLRCPCCMGERRPYPSVLRDFVIGEDAPTALLAEEILRCLPRQPDCQKKPADGRQLIAFSDARQRAAFFYPYLARTSCEPAYVHPLLVSLKKLEADGDVATPRRLIEAALQQVVSQPRVLVRRLEGDVEFYEHLKGRPTLEDQATIKESLASILYEQLGSTGRMRTKLPGMCLTGIRFDVDDDAFAQAASAIPELFATPALGRDWVSRLLLTLVRTQAVDFWPSQIDRRKVLGLPNGPTLVTVHRGGRATAEAHQMLQWNPFYGGGGVRSARGWVTARLLSKEAPTPHTLQQAQQVLDKVWDWLLDYQILEQHDTHPGEYRLPAKRLLLSASGPWYRCNKCGAVSIHIMNATCEMRGCAGHLETIDADQLREEQARSHRIKRFIQQPMPLSVREHTAQISLSEGKRIQRDFMNRDVNVLSSSTTFEMGVDVGQLEAVLLRNVPPTASNYVQRAGRAGRRRAGAAHAVSFARLTPHDQYHFHRPGEIVSGVVPVPVVYPKNKRLTQRHVNSLLLAEFLYIAGAGVDDPRIQDFFPRAKEALDGTTLAERFVSWLRTIGQDIRAKVEELTQRAEMDVQGAIDESGSSLFNTAHPSVWQRALLDPLYAFEKERSRLEAEKNELERDRTKSRAAAAVFIKMSRIDSLISQLLGERLIGALASCNWLPAYAFPQDTVQLLVLDPNFQSALRLERDRERGISEYAPESEIIADGKMFTSVAINLMGRTPDIKCFRFCEATRRVRIGLDDQALKQELPSVSGRPPKSGRFILPPGFMTSIDDKGRQPNLYRLKPPSNSQLFVVDSLDSSDFMPHEHLPGVTSGIYPNAQLFTANLGRSGRGFYLCGSCGSSSDHEPLPRSHNRPFGGKPCTGRQERVALADIFQTDVLQLRFPAAYTPTVIGEDGRMFWTTLAAAAARAASELHQIAPSDLEVTFRSISDADHRGELLLFDNVPGGAGFVQRVRDDLRNVLLKAGDILRDCPNKVDCGMKSSCYACLRTFNNQFDWQYLSREAPLAWLSTLCGA
jgi:ATP-dependent helicase YprA (DUF1998 family)